MNSKTHVLDVEAMGLSDDSVNPSLYQQELLAQWPRAILENLVWDNQGENLYISNLGAGTIEKYSVKTKSVTTLAILNWAASPDSGAHPFGRVVEQDGMIYGSAVTSPLTPDRKNLENAVFRIDKQGNVTWVMKEVPGNVWNGWTRLAPGVFLICDGYGGLIWKLDINKQTIDKWAENPLLEPVKGERVPGANGIKIYKNIAYVTSSALSLIVQSPSMKTATPEGRSLQE
jgi:hypothetical protein